MPPGELSAHRDGPGPSTVAEPGLSSAALSSPSACCGAAAPAIWGGHPGDTAGPEDLRNGSSLSNGTSVVCEAPGPLTRVREENGVQWHTAWP